MAKSIREELAFKDLTPQEKEQRGILGRLYGPCADIIRCTRNGRKYSDEVWEQVFNKNEIIKELLANGGIPGEAQHPVDRQEIDTEKIAIMMPEAPKKGDDGRLIAYFDILDTPCGRILYQLAKYGFKLGISSRGTGDVYENEDGEEEVDPDTYDFTCFDCVIIPAVKEARLEMVESLDKTRYKKSLRDALTEELNKAPKDDKTVMEETLNALNIDLTSSKGQSLTEDLSQNVADKKVEAADSGDNGLLETLQGILKEKTDLEEQLKQLQEKLAVSDTKVNSLNEAVNRYKSAMVKLSNVASKNKVLEGKVSSLEKNIQEKDSLIEKLNKSVSNLIEGRKKLLLNSKTINESLSSKDNEIKSLKEDLVKVKNNKELENKVSELQEELEETKADSKIKMEESQRKLSKADTLVEQCRKVTDEVVNRYIESKAKMFGISANRIKNELDEEYSVESLDQIDQICESLSSYNLNLNKLPFNLSENKIRVKKSTNESLQTYADNSDDVDDDLLRLANLK